MNSNKTHRIFERAYYTLSKLNVDYSRGKSSIQAGFIIWFNFETALSHPSPIHQPSSSHLNESINYESINFERFKNVTQSVTKHFIKKAGMILVSHVFIILDSKKSLWYTTFQYNMNVPDTA